MVPELRDLNLNPANERCHSDFNAKPGTHATAFASVCYHNRIFMDPANRTSKLIELTFRSP